MKTNKYIFAAGAALIAISCAKDNTAVVETAEKHIVRTTIEVTTDALTKADFNLNKDETAYQVSWENGDKVAVLQSNTTSNPVVKNMNKFTYDGSVFSGSISDLKSGSTWHALFPSSQFSGYSTANNVDAVIPDTQDGSKAMFNTCYLMYELNKSAVSETPSDQAAGTDIDDVSLSFTLKGFSSVIKLNVPEALKLKTITLSAKDANSADVFLAGDIKLRMANGNNGMLNGSGGAKYKGNSTSVTVSPADGNLSGDVYIYLLPDSFSADYGYYSTASSLNFEFTNADGAVCDKVVNINPEHPLRGGVLHNFGSLPEVLPFPFDFQLIMNASNNFKVKPAEYPKGTTFTYDYPGVTDATVAPTPTDNMYFTVTGAYNGATKTINAYYRVWNLLTGGEFESDALAAGITSGTATTSEICFTSNDLVCTCPTGGKITFNNTTYTTFNGVKVNDVNTPVSLCFNAIHDGMLSIGAAAASNGNANRKCFLYLNDDNIIVDETNECFIYTTNGGTGSYEFVKQVCDYMDVKADDEVKVTPAWNGQRFKKIYLLQWGENVKTETKSVTAESLSGTHNYDI